MISYVEGRKPTVAEMKKAIRRATLRGLHYARDVWVRPAQ